MPKEMLELSFDLFIDLQPFDEFADKPQTSFEMTNAEYEGHFE